MTEGLPRGMKSLTPCGTLTCGADHEAEYKGVRNGTRTFIYQAPSDENGTPVCLNCAHRTECCPHSDNGRTVTVSFDMLPHIDPRNPPMSAGFQRVMRQGTSVERMIKRLKCDLSDSRLTKRGNDSFQAQPDKTLIAFHILLRN